MRPLASKKDPKEPLWRPKGAQRSHCGGFGRLKWCPKAHFDGFGVPRCPQKLNLYDTDAPNWPQGPHFEGFGPQFADFNVFFDCVCVIFCIFSFRFSFCPAMLSLQPPSTSIISKNWQKQASPAENPAELASTPEASIISKSWQKQASPTENPGRTSIKTRSQHH